MDDAAACLEQPGAGRADRLRLGVLVVVWGMQAIVTQSLLLREALVLMFGSEFAWGVVLFSWLLGISVGATVGGCWSDRLRQTDTALVAVLLLLSAAACVELWVFRGARAWLGVEPGELLPLPKSALAAIVFVSPTSALVGVAFPLACRVGRNGQCGSLSIGGVYALEAAGSLIGGALFSFWAVEHLAPIQTALVCAALTAGAAALFVKRGRHANRPLRLLLASMAVSTALLAVSVGPRFERGLVDRRWHTLAPAYELVAEAESKYQNLALGRRAGQYSLYCDGHVSADFPDPYTYAPLAHFWMCQHPAPTRVLVLGGGCEGLLAEILRHPIERVDYVESDAQQITLVRPYLEDEDRAALNDPRVHVHYADARHYVKTRHGRFDLVIARLPEPVSAQRARFHTREFYGELRRAMTADAVLCMTAAAAPNDLSETSRAYLASVRVTLAEHFPHIVIGWGDPAQVLAGTAGGLVSTDPAELTGRYTSRGVQSKRFHPLWFNGATDWLEPGKLERRAAELDRTRDVPISTDLWPIVYIQRLELWEALAGTSHVIAWLRTVRLVHVVAALAGLGVLVLALMRLLGGRSTGWRSGVVTLSIGTTGFVTMALSIVWLFAFQNLYGYVYQRVGWIIALFMGGLVLGSALAARRVRQSASGATDAHTQRDLIVVDILLAILAAAVPLILPVLANLQTGPLTFRIVEWSVSLCVVLTGLLGGTAFPLAARLQQQMSGRIGQTAGLVDAADHAGACLGALLCGILLVPVLGTAVTAGLLAGTKIASAAALVAGGWARRTASRR